MQVPNKGRAKNIDFYCVYIINVMKYAFSRSVSTYQKLNIRQPSESKDCLMISSVVRAAAMHSERRNPSRKLLFELADGIILF